MLRLEDLLDGSRVAMLKPFAITEIVDLVGALEADQASVGRLLDLDADEAESLHAKALDALSASVREAVEGDRAAPPPMGAWDPDAA